jgi:hypothetical protein
LVLLGHKVPHNLLSLFVARKPLFHCYNTTTQPYSHHIIMFFKRFSDKLSARKRKRSSIGVRARLVNRIGLASSSVATISNPNKKRKTTKSRKTDGDPEMQSFLRKVKLDTVTCSSEINPFASIAQQMVQAAPLPASSCPPPSPPCSPAAKARLPHFSIRNSYREALKKPRGRQEFDRTNTRVRFEPSVKVIEIPLCDTYNEFSKRNMWTSKQEIKENKRRNAAEFRADKSDWRRCLEESSFIEYNGDLLHPYTYHRMIQAETKKNVSELRTNAARRTLIAGRHNKYAAIAQRLDRPGAWCTKQHEQPSWTTTNTMAVSIYGD